jgi:dihydroflavonol-4-reductase
MVTGISGYLGLHVAKALLESGHRVRGTIRNRSKESSVREALPDPAGMLSFAICDLTSDSGWAEAFDGVDALIHVASPFILREPKDEQEYLRPAVEGTRRVMRFALDAGVTTSVVTSTYLTMAGHMFAGTFGPEDHTPLGDPSINAYIRSKVAAEEALWDFVTSEAPDMSVSTIHPGAILGPPLGSDSAGTSVSTIRGMISGSVPGIPPISVPMVDVRDVAIAHVAALEIPAANGQRFAASHPEPIRYLEVAKILRAAGYTKVPSREIPQGLIWALAPVNRELRSMKAFLGKSVYADTSNTTNDLHWKPRPIEQTVLDTAAAL